MTTRRTINHSECFHAATPAGRAACRKSGEWALRPVNVGHTFDCIQRAAGAAWDNDESLTNDKDAWRVGIAYLENAVTDCTCNGIPGLDD